MPMGKSAGAAHPLFYATSALLFPPILRHLLPKAIGMVSKEFTSLLNLISTSIHWINSIALRKHLFMASQDGRVEGHALIFSWENSKIATNH